MKYPVITFLLLFALLTSCGTQPKKDGLRFTFLPSAQTGVDFSNTVTENDSLNLFVNEYTYMGGGVGVGDFNNDGLPDLFFAGNQVSSKLYLNKGGMHFKDITVPAGLTTNAWCTGVSVTDINNDGWPDIYVCVSGKLNGMKRRNLLFINQHNLTFKEEASAYGLADTSYSTQAVFFDYDHDGRLDVYLLNHTLNDAQPNNIRDTTIDSNAVAADKLYHNEGVEPATGHPVFLDVSRRAGIVEDGNGLGIVVTDVNNDGYPDLYVANDYIRNDIVWLNNKNGTFSNCISSAIRHQSYSSMGTDAADVNNDGLPDIITLDMQPETNSRKKMMYTFLNERRRQLEAIKGYQPQYVHNMLQLNNGVRQIHKREEPFFSEVSYMAGIAETDWSWSVLITDFDNDGWKDLHITNGLGRDATNNDFVEYMHDVVVKNGTSYYDPEQRKVFNQHLATLGSLNLHNYLYKNNGNLTFADVSQQAGINQLSISNGAAYADLDNDGDMDIVANNINSAAFVMRNDVISSVDTSQQYQYHYLTLKLEGDSLNKEGIGAKVFAYSNGLTQVAELYPVRGYLSTVDSRIHFGFGANTADSVKVVWPDGKMTLISKPGTNRLLTINYKNAGNGYSHEKPLHDIYFTDAITQSNVIFQHKETFFYDYGFQPLLLQKYSQEGPFISTGDLNGDGLQDFFIGGAAKQSGKIFLQQPDGSFAGKDLVAGIKNEEDMQSLLFDADGDGDNDLLVTGGSTEFELTPAAYRLRLYINDGKGNFTLNTAAIPSMVHTPSKAIAMADMDGDGDMDVFIGGRVSLGAYPQPVVSYVLRNDKGKFTDVTNAVCPQLASAGLINAVEWTDIDRDGRPDLILAGDWAPIRIFKNEVTKFTEITAQTGTDSLPGFWRSLAIADVDNDGDLDIIAGNLGVNNPYHISASQPAQLMAKDFDGNGLVEPVLCYYIKNEQGNYELSAGISRDEWAGQMPIIKKRFENNAAYAKAGTDNLFTAEMMQGATVLTCKEVRSGYFENDGKGKFNFHPFPSAAQVAPVNAIVCTDVNMDGKMDIILAGNEYQSNVTAGRLDASYGLLLLGKGHAEFEAVPPTLSGLIIDGDTKDLKIVKGIKQPLLIAAINDSGIKAFSIRIKQLKK